MPNEKRCETCTDECFKYQMAHEAAVGRMYATNEFIALQKKIESGQLVEVVRCRNCKYYKPEEYECGCDFAGGLQYVKADDFCSYGEMRDDSATD